MVIAVYNNKGGVGKTSLVAHVGFRAMELQKEITVFDADLQSNAVEWLTNGQWDNSTTLHFK
jgi:cellulose biosynthesis protein BcsQ